LRLTDKDMSLKHFRVLNVYIILKNKVYIWVIFTLKCSWISLNTQEEKMVRYPFLLNTELFSSVAEKNVSYQWQLFSSISKCKICAARALPANSNRLSGHQPQSSILCIAGSVLPRYRNFRMQSQKGQKKFCGFGKI
jgi:hypothetical protein